MIHVAICSPYPALRAGLRALLDADPDLAVVAASDEPSGLGGAYDARDGETRIDVIVATPERLDGLPAAPILLITADPHAVEALRGRGHWAWGALSPDAPAEALQAAIHALAEGLVVLSPELVSGVEFSHAHDRSRSGEDGSDSDAELAESDAAGTDYAASTSAAKAAGAISKAAAGKSAAGKAAASAIASGAPRTGEPASPIEPLTARETEVLRCLADGLTNKQTALALGISEHTVKFHVSSIYSKMGVSNRAEAVSTGARRGWLPL